LNFLRDLEMSFEKKDFFSKCGEIYIIGDAGKLDITDQRCYTKNNLRAEKEGIVLATYFVGVEIPEFEGEDQKNIMKKEIQGIYDKEDGYGRMGWYRKKG
ncbi:MAG: hypothetical protein R6U54_05540, partial [Candidatus Omnitrophota bacterium]